MTTDPKLTKDQIQKLALSVIGFIALIYVYFSFFLGPLNNSLATAERSIADLTRKLAASESDVKKARNLEQQASEATTRFAAMKALSPEGAPIAWFPPRVRTFFANHNIERAHARLESHNPFPETELADWARYTWIIDLPQTDFVTLGKAIANLENSEPLLAVSRISIKAVADEPQFQQVSLVANNIVQKQQ
jgi:hypothetical protein